MTSIPGLDTTLTGGKVASRQRNPDKSPFDIAYVNGELPGNFGGGKAVHAGDENCSEIVVQKVATRFSHSSTDSDMAAGPGSSPGASRLCGDSSSTFPPRELVSSPGCHLPGGDRNSQTRQAVDIAEPFESPVFQADAERNQCTLSGVFLIIRLARGGLKAASGESFEPMKPGPP